MTETAQIARDLILAAWPDVYELDSIEVTDKRVTAHGTVWQDHNPAYILHRATFEAVIDYNENNKPYLRQYATIVSGERAPGAPRYALRSPRGRERGNQ